MKAKTSAVVDVMALLTDKKAWVVIRPGGNPYRVVFTGPVVKIPQEIEARTVLSILPSYWMGDDGEEIPVLFITIKEMK